jgi:hypothetical protein
MADLGEGGKAHPLAREGASDDKGIINGSDAARHHTVELLDLVGGKPKVKLLRERLRSTRLERLMRQAGMSL